MAERYGAFADTPTAMAEIEPQTYAMTTTASFDETVSVIDGAPLYLFSSNAEARAHKYLIRDLAQIPTIPTCGATLVDSKSAVYVKLDNGVTASIAERVQKTGLTPIMTCRFVCGYSLDDPTHGRNDILMDATSVVGHDSEGKIQFSVVRVVNVMALEERDQLQIFFLGLLLDGSLRSTMLIKSYDGKKIYGIHKMEQDGAAAIQKDAANQLHTALSELEYVDQPCHYVVEQRPVGVEQERIKRVKAARFDDRERWILLDPEEVRVHFSRAVVTPDSHADGHGTHAAPVPHLRRAHNRVLRSSRYTFMRGATIHVRPTWVGDREWSYQGARYKVVSRPGASETQA